VLRFLQDDNRPFVQYLFAQAAAYMLAQQVFYRFELAPFAKLDLTFRFDETRLKDRPVLPEYYGDYFSIDLANQTFTDSILMTTVRMLRVTDAGVSTPELRETLERFERDNLPSNVRAQWQ